MSELRNKLISFGLASKEFKDRLKDAVGEITEEVKSAPNEATVEGIFERVLYGALREIGIKFHPKKEVIIDSIRHTGTGRVDSRIGAVVIEYKHRSKLKSQKLISTAQNQLKDYIRSISLKLHNEVIGFLTDGLSLYEIRAFNRDITSTSGKLKVSHKTLLTLTRIIVSLEQAALTAENLIRDFCSDSYQGVLFDLARILNSILQKRATPKTKMLKSEWEGLFRLAHDDRSQQKRIEERRLVLSEIFKHQLTDASAEYSALFALHTAYAIVLKFLAYRVVSDLRFGAPLQDYKSLICSQSQVLRSFCSSLEDGEIFRRVGILNLLEGDFFSWYADRNQWNTELKNSIQEILEILGRYEDVSSIFTSVDVIDLFRDLYEATVPRVVRASFGEIYTPLWLAEHVLQASGLKENWRALDPCCGSGTFVIAAISQIRKEKRGESKPELLRKILARVAAIDLNPLGVLTTRINYFIHIADLLPSSLQNLVVPVFLGDASYVAEKVKISEVECLSYELRTLKDPISLELPTSLVQDTAKFVRLMYKYENLVRNKDSDSASNLLLASLSNKLKKPGIKRRILRLSQQLVALERKGWNGIWARIITNFLITACLDRFTNIIGNPPWIDWKNLPEGYRNRVKSLCIDKGLFSGAGRTGGINLNICALIAHVTLTSWLTEDGKLSFLMPRELAYQSSYEGWRRSVGGTNRFFLEFHDWSDAGHPFDPGSEDFMTYIIGTPEQIENLPTILPVTRYVKKKSVKTQAHRWSSLPEALKNLQAKECVAGHIIPGSNAYTFSETEYELSKLEWAAGACSYIGREGVEFYPQELLIFKYEEPGPEPGLAWVRNIQKTKSKYKIPSQRILLETKYLYPLVKGPAIDRFVHKYDNLIVPLPYERDDPHRPIPVEQLEKQAPLLLAYFQKYEDTVRAQTAFSDKIRGPDAGEFYGLARTGPYTFQNVYVAFRDNTKWRAVVITSTKMPWGEEKRFVFQNHAVSICERTDKSGYITDDEAHYICAILNAPTVERFIYASSDTRSFKIRPPVFVPKYDSQNPSHIDLAKLSKLSHKSPSDIRTILIKIDHIYQTICSKK